MWAREREGERAEQSRDLCTVGHVIINVGETLMTMLMLMMMSMMMAAAMALGNVYGDAWEFLD